MLQVVRSRTSSGGLKAIVVTPALLTSKADPASSHQGAVVGCVSKTMVFKVEAIAGQLPPRANVTRQQRQPCVAVQLASASPEQQLPKPSPPT